MLKKYSFVCLFLLHFIHILCSVVLWHLNQNSVTLQKTTQNKLNHDNVNETVSGGVFVRHTASCRLHS